MSESPAKKDELRDVLNELHEALGSAQWIDPALEGPLRGALEDLQDAIERAGGEAPSRRLSERIEELALDFEVAHPTIAGTLNRLTHQLASMGI